MEEIWASNSRLRMDYLELRDNVESIRSNAKKSVDIPSNLFHQS